MKYINHLGETETQVRAIITNKAPPYMSDTEAYWYEVYCEKYGLPEYRNGYWFWVKANKNDWGIYTYFAVDKGPLKAWDPNAWRAPPYQRDVQWVAYKGKIEQPATQPMQKPPTPPTTTLPVPVPSPTMPKPVDPKIPIPAAASTPTFLLAAICLAVGSTTYSITRKYR